MRLLFDTVFLQISRILAATGVVGVLAIGLVENGATRMYAWPWSLALLASQIAPLAGLAFRGLVTDRPIKLPPRPWTLAFGVLACGVAASSLASPYREVSLYFAATPLAGLAFVVLAYDALNSDREDTGNALNVVMIAIGGLVAVISLTLSAANLWTSRATWPDSLIHFRNPYPLGHANYTAGLAILLLPWAILPPANGGRLSRWFRVAVALLLLLTLFSSGSRGALLGIGAGAATWLWFAELSRGRKVSLAALAIVAIVALGVANPRTRELLFTRAPTAQPNISTVQRSAMFAAGVQMGKDRPWLGWGAGTTPLAYPRYRHLLDGGVEVALQLHSTPVQWWADYGVVGIGALLAVLAVSWGALRARLDRIGIAATVSLTAYSVFACTDFQLDLPIFVFLSAISLAALLPTPAILSSVLGYTTSAVSALFACVVIGMGQPDATPALTVHALMLADKTPESAVAELKHSLEMNPDQEIAHFNLAWLLLNTDAKAAELHFLRAATLVPDKSGVYFGIGLARLGKGKIPEAAQAFALECLNSPVFAASGWWRLPALNGLRPQVAAALDADVATIRLRLAHDAWRIAEASYVQALVRWLWRIPTGESVHGLANTPQRRVFFATNPDPTVLDSARIIRYRHIRTGYPVVMRAGNLAPPQDIYEVLDNERATRDLAYLFPAKGWLPSPLLLSLLAQSPRLP